MCVATIKIGGQIVNKYYSQSGWGLLRPPHARRLARDIQEALGLEAQPSKGTRTQSSVQSPGELVGDTASRPSTRSTGFTDRPAEAVSIDGTTASRIAGVTSRQLDYWARTGLVTPSVESGGDQQYSVNDLLSLKVAKRLLDAGVSLSNVRIAVNHIANRPVSDLAGVTLFSDGRAVYEANSAEEVVDLLQSGRGSFGISVGGAITELEEVLHLHFANTSTSSKEAIQTSGNWLYLVAG